MSQPIEIPAPLASTPILQLFSLPNRTIIIPGGGRGLGLAAVIGCLEAGACVAALDLLPTPTEPDWSQASEIAKSKGLKLTYANLDVSDPGLVTSVIRKVFEDAPEGAPVRGLFQAAGVPSHLSVVDTTFEQWQKVLTVNTTGTFLCCKAFAEEWIKRNPNKNGQPDAGGASIVLTASIAGHVANREVTCSSYSASKAAVLHMTKSLAAEWGSVGIRVNSISPGYIKTVMTAGIVAKRPGYEDNMVNQTLLKRFSTADEYRGPLVFLLSDASSFVIGTDLIVDGGHGV